MTTDERKDRGSRRHRKGDYQAPTIIPALVPDTISRQIDPEHFVALIARAEAFAQRRFGPILAQLGAAFFRGRSPAEVREQGLQAAFRAWVLYGFRDENGVRIIDMFAAAGIPPKAEVARALVAARQARFGFFEVLERNPRTKQVRARDLTSGEESPADELDFLDRNSYESLEISSVFAAWFVPVGALWRPVGAATLVPAAKHELLITGFERLLASQKLERAAFANKNSMQLFWLAYSVANLESEMASAKAKAKAVADVNAIAAVEAAKVDPKSDPNADSEPAP